MKQDMDESILYYRFGGAVSGMYGEWLKIIEGKSYETFTKPFNTVPYISKNSTLEQLQ